MENWDSRDGIFISGSNDCLVPMIAWSFCDCINWHVLFILQSFWKNDILVKISFMRARWSSSRWNQERWQRACTTTIQDVIFKNTDIYRKVYFAVVREKISMTIIIWSKFVSIYQTIVHFVFDRVLIALNNLIKVKFSLGVENIFSHVSDAQEWTFWKVIWFLKIIYHSGGFVILMFFSRILIRRIWTW